MDRLSVARAARERLSARRPERARHGRSLEQLLKGSVVQPTAVEPLDRQRERARRLGRMDLLPRLGRDNAATRELFELVIGNDDSLPRKFLELGSRAARSVGRIVAPLGNGATRFGTGSLIAPSLVLTNNHVLESSAVAATAALELEFYELGPSTFPDERQAFALAPQDFFFTDEELDFTLVGVQEANAGRTTADYGFLRVGAESGKALLGERLNIVHHAGGGPQLLGIRSNVLVDLFDHWMHYTTDTEMGSSGAPLFNDGWELTGLHHASVPSTSGETQGFVNEGIRISSILERLRTAFS